MDRRIQKKNFFIDFRNKPDGVIANKFRATVIATLKEQRVAILSVEPKTASGLELPSTPLVLAKAVSVKPGNPLYIVGYPARDVRTQEKYLKAIFQDIYDVKRLQPGYFISVDSDAMKLFHDCVTVGGNSGSPVIDLESGKVIGLHVGGKPISESGPAEKYAVALWMLANNPEMKKAGITFQ